MFLVLQDGLVWHRGGIWSREEDQPTQCPVSHCQHRGPSGSHTQDQVLANPKSDLILLRVLISPHNFLMCVYIWAGVSVQVGACQSDVPVPSPPDRSAAAQRCLLRHRGTPAGLHGHPQTDHHTIYTSTERAVSAPPHYLILI